VVLLTPVVVVVLRPGARGTANPVSTARKIFYGMVITAGSILVVAARLRGSARTAPQRHR
jgi:hypothetical protein